MRLLKAVGPRLFALLVVKSCLWSRDVVADHGGVASHADDDVTCPAACACVPLRNVWDDDVMDSGHDDDVMDSGHDDDVMDSGHDDDVTGASTSVTSPPIPEGTVDCQGANLDELPDLTKVSMHYTAMTFSENRIEYITSGIFDPHDRLETLNFSHNNIAHIDLYAFQKLTSLKSVDLSKNELQYVMDNSFYGLDSLTFLDLSSNRFQDFGHDMFSLLTSLTIINLSDNPVLDILDDRLFDNNEWLTVTILEKMNLKNLENKIFRDKQILSEIQLGENQLTRVPMEAIQQVYLSVMTVNLSSNPINVIATGDFKNMPELTRVYLNDLPQLTEVQPYSFSQLPVIDHVHITHAPQLTEMSNLTFYSPDGDSFDQDLTTLNLSHNYLTTISENLLNWKRVGLIDLSYNSWICDCQLRWVLFLNSSKFYNQKHFQCASPSYLANRPVLSLNHAWFNCWNDPISQADLDRLMKMWLQSSTRTVVIVVLVVAGVAFLFSLLAFIVWRRRRHGPFSSRWRRRQYTSGEGGGGSGGQYVTMKDVEEASRRMDHVDGYAVIDNDDDDNDDNGGRKGDIVEL